MAQKYDPSKRPNPGQLSDARADLVRRINTDKPLTGEGPMLPVGLAGFGKAAIGRAEIEAANSGAGKVLGEQMERGKDFGRQKYPTSIRVRVHHGPSMETGSPIITDDEVKGMNKAHAMWRAALNWAHATKIERLP